AVGHPAETVGTWKAKPDDKATFQMVLNKDGTFNWTVNASGEMHSFSGTYVIEGDKLVLNRANDGQKLVGKLTWNGDAGFNFKLNDTPKEDPGLNFRKG